MEFLPREGVCGTVYLYLQEDGWWHAMTWNGKQYTSHAHRQSLEELSATVDNMLWTNGWPRVEVKAASRKMNPCVRVELAFKDGTVQRLTGEHAEAWLKNVNDIVGAAQLRYGQSQMNEHPWEITRKEPDQ